MTINAPSCSWRCAAMIVPAVLMIPVVLSDELSTVRMHASPRAISKAATVEDSPSFLGLGRDGVSAETQMLKTWPDGGPTLLWELSAGAGFASPAIVGDRLVYFHRVGDRERVECMRAESGEKLWSYEYSTDYKDRYEINPGPRGSPTIDDGRVYVHGVQGVLSCLDLQTGRVVWQRNTSTEFKVPQDFFGVGSTPLVVDNLLIVNVGAPGGPEVVAFDKVTGKIRWKAGKGWTAGYASPVETTIGGERRLLVFSGGDIDPPVGGLLCLVPETGAEVFRFPFRSRNYISVNSSNPVVVAGRVFLSSSYRTGGVALDLKADGSYAEAWRTREFGAHFATPIVRDGYLYGIHGSGQNDAAIVCLDWKTGEQQWRTMPTWPETVERNGKKQTMQDGVFMGSLMYADGRFWILGEHGHLVQAELSPEGFREIQHTRLFNAKETWTPPVLSHGLLYICQNQTDRKAGTTPRLLCYDLRGP